MDTLFHDLRYAVRMLRRSPGFAAAAVLTLALGMGANTVMFSVLNTVLLRPLPYTQPDRLLQIWETDSARGETQGPISPYDFLDWQKQSATLEATATYSFGKPVLSGQKIPTLINAVHTTADFFAVFKAKPLRGRTFLPSEDAPGKDRVVVLSYGAWQRYFSGDQSIVGKSITLDGDSYSVIGVVPADFQFPTSGVEAWCLPGFDLKGAGPGRGSRGLFAVGRMKPGVTLHQAQTEMNTIAARLAAQYPQNKTTGFRLVGLQDEMVGGVRRTLLVLWGSVLAVLLIACANVAGLMMARAFSRQKEIGIRLALGGSRARLVRQFLTESSLLAAIGGSLGLLLSLAAGKLVIAGSSGAVPRLRTFEMDGWVLAFTALACVVTGILFGTAPALHALRPDINESLKEAATHSTRTAERLRLRSAFVVMEIALALVLLVCAGLLSKTLWELQHVNPGFQAENVLGLRISVPEARYPQALQRGEFYQQIVERLAVIPGVVSAGATNDLPFSGSRTGTSFEIEGQPSAPGVALYSDYRRVSSDYMRTMQTRLLEGREFSSHDNQDAPRVAIINQAFGKKFLPGKDPVGQRLKIHDQWFEVVGVVANVKLQSLRASGNAEMYVPILQADPPPWSFLVVRSPMEVSTLVPTVRKAVSEVAPDEPVYDVRTMADRLAFSLAPQRFTSLLLGIFAGLALLLAAIGIYGVISYSVAQRTHEIGIRMALGADRDDVLHMVLKQGAKIALLGLCAGVVAALLATAMLSSLLYGVAARDPIIFLCVAGLLFVVVLLASYGPARRASKVDPLEALRCE